MGAQDIPTSFQVSPDDQSGQMLAELLGKGWDTVTGHDLSTSAATLAHEVLSTFNWVTLAAVSALFVIVISQGVAGTANEGVAFGKRYSSLWMPLRFAGAMSFLAPIIKGFSIWQVAVLLSVGYSVNIANYVWGKGVNFFVESGGQISLHAPESLVEDSQSLAAGALKSLVSQQYFSQHMDLNVGDIVTENYVSGNDKDMGSYQLTFTVPSGSSLNAGDLGRIVIPCSSQNDSLCSGRLSAVRQLLGDLDGLAAKIANVQEELSGGDSGALARAVRNYQLSVQPYLSQVESEESQKLESDLKEFADKAGKNGWAVAGSYYWTISRLNEQSRRAIYSQVSFTDAGYDALPGKAMADFDAIKTRYDYYTKGAFAPEREVSAQNTAASVGEEYGWEWFKSKIVQGGLGKIGLSHTIQQMQTSDPIATMSSLGSGMIVAGEVAIVGSTAARGTTAGLAGVAKGIWAESVSFGTAAGVADTVYEVVKYITTIVTALAIVLLTYGFVLAYFLPAIPYVLWISAVISWLILVMESLVAAPLWVAAHALPEGEGLAGNSGRQGYMLFLGVLLRPPLMIFGFLIAMALLNGIGRIIGNIFAVFGFDMLDSFYVGISGFMAYAVILGTTVIIAAYRLFGLVNHLPERVTNWIGQQLHSLGEKDDAHTMQSKYQGAGYFSNSVMQSGAQAMGLADVAAKVGDKKSGNGQKGEDFGSTNSNAVVPASSPAQHA